MEGKNQVQNGLTRENAVMVLKSRIRRFTVVAVKYKKGIAAVHVKNARRSLKFLYEHPQVSVVALSCDMAIVDFA